MWFSEGERDWGATVRKQTQTANLISLPSNVEIDHAEQ
jgi:hypothetical protein